MSEIKDDEKDLALHEYDGIVELDNNLPMWWLLTFYGTIIFSFIYFVHYHLAGGPSSDEELKQGMAKIEQKMMASQKQAEADLDWTALVDNEEVLAMGQKAYNSNCVACHGMHGEGGIGPNLTDSYWIHGDGSMPEINRILKEGVIEKGMPAWNTVLKPKEMQATTAYVYTLIGTNPENAKGPQGEKVISE